MDVAVDDSAVQAAGDGGHLPHAEGHAHRAHARVQVRGKVMPLRLFQIGHAVVTEVTVPLFAPEVFADHVVESSAVLGCPCVTGDEERLKIGVAAPVQQVCDLLPAQVHVGGGDARLTPAYEQLDHGEHIGIGGAAALFPRPFTGRSPCPRDAGLAFQHRPDFVQCHFRRAV